MSTRCMRQRRIVHVGHFRLIGFLLWFFAGPLWAQAEQAEQPDDPHAGHQMSSPASTQTNEHGEMHGMESVEDGPANAADDAAKMDTGMSMGSMQGGSPPPDARDPHAYSDGYRRSPFGLRLADDHNFSAFLMDRFEAVRADDDTGGNFDLQAWYGRTFDRATLKSEGDYLNGTLEEADVELLWTHAVAAYWDTQLGLRYDDQGDGAGRTWLAAGIQGLAPYWFEIDATVYLGESGHTALNIEAEYELLLTQKWILQPRIEADFHGQNDVERGIGSGLSEVAAGLRLRYEIRRELAPYIGVEWVERFGETKDLLLAANEDARESKLVAGLRFWF